MKILNIDDGIVLSGESYVMVAPDGNYRQCGVYDIKMLVDGEDVLSASVQPQEDGSWAVPLCLETNYYSNGPHRLMVTDRLGSVDTRVVQFDNVIQQVRYDEPSDAATQTDAVYRIRITASVSPAQRWEATISSLWGNIVREYSGIGDRIDVWWDGTDHQNNVVEDDAYLLTLSTLADGVAFNSFVNKSNMHGSPQS